MNLWIDLANSPQVLVLAPIIRELEERGHQVIVTSRPFAQTVQLADQLGLRHVALGEHGGASRRGSLQRNLQRIVLLMQHLRGKAIDLALSHNSYSQGIAARALRIPFVTMMDYEHHRANHLAFRLARRVLVPAVFPSAALRRFGAEGKAVRYPGLKEEIYLANFRASADFAEASGLPHRRVIAVLRPPGTWGDYYHGNGNIAIEVLNHLKRSSECFLVFLPRLGFQTNLLKEVDFPADRVLVPTGTLDGPNLLAHADLAISGGGTMNREAAVLGTPAYTIFEGKLGAVDNQLVGEGRLHWVQTLADLADIRVEKKSQRDQRLANPHLAAMLTSAILEAA